MSESIQLHPGENVVMSQGEVGYGGGGISIKNNELILTSESLILLKKGLFGKTKETIRFPLSDIVISDNKAQVRYANKDHFTPTLEVFFTSGMERFLFTWDEDAKKMANAIISQLTGQPAVYKETDFFDDMTDIGQMAETLTGAVKGIKKVFGIKSHEQRSAKCPSCGAPLSGTEGETVKCPYCDTFYTFQ